VPIHNAVEFISEAEDRRKNQMMMDSGTEIFHMRTLRDLSARDGTLVYIEYSEEHPPLLNQPGMASKIRNYYRRVCFLCIFCYLCFRRLKKKTMFNLSLARQHSL
jgi:hypothetical protein